MTLAWVLAFDNSLICITSLTVASSGLEVMFSTFITSTFAVFGDMHEPRANFLWPWSFSVTLVVLVVNAAFCETVHHFHRILQTSL